MTADYRLLLPDGWYRYTVKEASDRVARTFLDRHLPQLSGDHPDAVEARRRARSDIAAGFTTMADAGTVDLYYFDGQFGGVPMSMLFTIGVAYLGPGAAELGLSELAPALASDASVVELPIGPVVRARKDAMLETGTPLPATIPSTVAAAFLAHTTGEGGELMTRVDYLAPIAGEAGSFVLVSFRTVGAQFLEERVAHFDILMTGFSWGSTR